MSHVLEFIAKAETLKAEFPYIYAEISAEISHTRTTDWMAHLLSKPNGEVLCRGQGLTAADACADALAGFTPEVVPVDMAAFIKNMIDCEFSDDMEFWTYGPLIGISSEQYYNQNRSTFNHCRPRLNRKMLYTGQKLPEGLEVTRL